MLMNLSDVLSEQHKTIDQTVPVELEEIRVGNDHFPIVKKEAAHLVIRHIKEKELSIQGECRLSVSIPCDRCLTDVVNDFSLEIHKIVDLGNAEAELLEEFDESNYIDGYELDVDRLIYNEILVGWPTKVLCREDCKGICSVCGQNLNKGSCDCDDPGLDPRMSVIRDMFQNFKEV